MLDLRGAHPVLDPEEVRRKRSAQLPYVALELVGRELLHSALLETGLGDREKGVVGGLDARRQLVVEAEDRAPL